MAADPPDAGTVVAALPLPVLVVGRAGRLRTVNPAAAAVVGEGLVGRHHVAAFRQPAALEAVEDALAGRAARAAFRASEAGRDTFWDMHATPLPGGGATILLQDRTAGAELGQLRRDFVANVSHELKTPLTALMGFIETLRGRASDDPAARARFLAVMDREAGRMARLVDDLLSLSRVEAEARLRPRGRVPLAGAAQRALQGVAPAVEAAGVRVASDLAPGAVASGDADQIVQVATNLLENAVKYGRPGGTIEIGASGPAPEPGLKDAPGVRLWVRDDGPGIEAHHLPRLTERFYRIDTHRSRERGGTGLGLAIVKHIVARHRGHLGIASTPGAGSVFTVILPAAAGPD